MESHFVFHTGCVPSTHSSLGGAFQATTQHVTNPVKTGPSPGPRGLFPGRVARGMVSLKPKSNTISCGANPVTALRGMSSGDQPSRCCGVGALSCSSGSTEVPVLESPAIDEYVCARTCRSSPSGIKQLQRSVRSGMPL